MLLMCGRRARFVGVVSFLFLVSLLPLAAPAMAGQGAANPAGITGVVTDNTGRHPARRDGHGDQSRVAGAFGDRVSRTSGASTACRRCRLASTPSSSSCPAFRTSGARACG